MSRITSSFGPRSTALEVVKGHDLRGRTVIVTGGASGIGVETARALLVAGAEVLLGVRDVGKAEAVVQTLRKETGNDKLAAATLDLAALESVRRFAADFLHSGRPLHLLINNAGTMAGPFAHTADGFESQFGTNHLGHYALTVLLLPALRKGAPARVVSLSSSAHRRADVNFADVGFKNRPYDKWEAYGQSKTANALFAIGVSQHFGKEGIWSNSVMPGGILTGLQQHLPKEEMRAMGWIDEHGTPHAAFKNTAQGAATTIWAAVAPELEGIGGRYLEDCQEAAPFSPDRPYSGVMPHALSAENAERLWTLSAELTGIRASADR